MEITTEQRKCQSDFKAFVDENVLPHAGVQDREERISLDLIRTMASAGYLGSMIPAEYKGMGLDTVRLGFMNEEFGRGCSSTRSMLTVHGMVALAINRWGTSQQKQLWLPRMACGEVIGAFALTEPNVGSDANRIETYAVRSNAEYILNGRKKWITMGQIADVFLVFAKCDNKPMAFLIDKHTIGLSIIPIKGLMGNRASMMAELVLQDCKVTEEFVVGREGLGLSHVAASCLDYGRYTIAWGCVGLGRACLEESLQYANKRKQFGELLSKNQLIQKMITEMLVEVKAARLLCLNAGTLKDVGDPSSIPEIWTAKYFASQMAVKTANYAVQIHGAAGYHNSTSVERFYRDAKANEIIEGTSQMHEIVIANQAISMI